jgi:hypothetical protein
MSNGPYLRDPDAKNDHMDRQRREMFAKTGMQKKQAL